LPTVGEFYGQQAGLFAREAARVLAGQAQKDGRGLPIIDSLLAATAIHHNLTLVTCNTGDVASTGALLCNPREN
jgi:predicted nucleic acid-binding protein